MCKNLCEFADIVPCLNECSVGWRWNVIASVSWQDCVSERFDVIGIAGAEGLTFNLIRSDARYQLHSWLADDDRHEPTLRAAEHGLLDSCIAYTRILVLEPCTDERPFVCALFFTLESEH